MRLIEEYGMRNPFSFWSLDDWVVEDIMESYRGEIFDFFFVMIFFDICFYVRWKVDHRRSYISRLALGKKKDDHFSPYREFSEGHVQVLCIVMFGRVRSNIFHWYVWVRKKDLLINSKRVDVIICSSRYDICPSISRISRSIRNRSYQIIILREIRLNRYLISDQWYHDWLRNVNNLIGLCTTFFSDDFSSSCLLPRPTVKFKIIGYVIS